MDYGTLYSHLVSQNVKHVVDGNCKDVLTWLVGRVSGLLPVLELCLGTRGLVYSSLVVVKNITFISNDHIKENLPRQDQSHSSYKVYRDII